MSAILAIPPAAKCINHRNPFCFDNHDLMLDYEGSQTDMLLTYLCAKKDMSPVMDVSAALSLQSPRQRCDGWLLCDLGRLCFIAK